MTAAYTNNLTNSFIGIQKLYTLEYPYVNKPKVEILDKTVVGSINRATGEILFQLVPDHETFQDDGLIYVKPLFDQLDRSHFFHEEDSFYRPMMGRERERPVWFVRERLPIKKIHLSHNIQDEFLIQELGKAEKLANRFFYESNLSLLSWISGLAGFLI